MSDEKTQPTGRISFAETKQDHHGQNKVGTPVQVATIWPRKGDKQGGIVDWHIAPEKLGKGVYFHLDNERQQQQGQEQPPKDAFAQVEDKKQDRDQGMGR